MQSPYTYSVTLLKVVKSSREMQLHNMFGPIVYYGNMYVPTRKFISRITYLLVIERRSEIFRLLLN